MSFVTYCSVLTPSCNHLLAVYAICGRPVLIPGLSKWVLWRKKWPWDWLEYGLDVCDIIIRCPTQPEDSSLFQIVLTFSRDLPGSYLYRILRGIAAEMWSWEFTSPSAEFNEKWSYTTIFPYAFRAWSERTSPLYWFVRICKSLSFLLCSISIIRLFATTFK